MKKALFCAVSFFVFGAAYGQHRFGVSTAISDQKILFDSTFRSSVDRSGGMKDIIVEFNEPPLFIAQRNRSFAARSVSSDLFERRFSEFSSDVMARQSSLSKTSQASAQIKNTYYRTFFGVRMSASADLIPMIQQLPYVKSVHPNKEVHADLERSVPMIGADRVWQVYGVQGENVRVGIIDSGIDYMHPALGGGFGTGFKVAGGFDFVNNDNDPMDDNGHGTHVAGIVGANSDALKGVAPKSVFYAYKVLNSGGRGMQSDIIAAVERSIDPNQDGNPSDKLDVVNMSLGSDSGTPDDPDAVAVNNAASLGIVFCISAGNNGYRTPTEGKEENYFYNGSASIGSPGTAELAITVGASDTLDHFARFSSKGPNRNTFGIKPEVLAPGVEINSTFLSGTTKRLNGTSMSSPHIAGVAALLKSLHPNWTAQQIKSAIVNTAKDLGESAYLQGNGRVRAFNAASVSTFLYPTVINFGMNDPSPASWMQAETVYVYNGNAASQSYTAAVSGNKTGIALSVSPSSFSIPAHDSIAAVMTVTVTNGVLPLEYDNILLFSGRVQFNGTVDTVSMPWAFSRTNKMVITTNEPDVYFLGYSSTRSIFSTDETTNWTTPTRVEIYAVEPGTYEFFTLFRRENGSSKIVIKESVPVSGNSFSLNVSSGEAVHPLVYRSVDHNGNLLSGYRADQRSLVVSMPNFGDWVTTLRSGSDTLYLSPVTNRYGFRPLEFQNDFVDTKTFHIAQYDKFLGINGGKTLSNNPSDFLSQQFVFNFPPKTSRAGIINQLFYYNSQSGEEFLYPVGYEIDTVYVDSNRIAIDGYIEKGTDPSIDVAAEFFASYTDLERLSIDYDTQIIMTMNDSLIPLTRKYATPSVPRSPSGGTMTFGDVPVHLFMLWYNNTTGSSTLHFRTLFRGPLRETRENDVNLGTYTLYDKNGNNLFTHPLNDFPRSPLELAPEPYTMVVSTENYWVRDQQGKGTYTSTFDLSKPAGVNPPSFTSLWMKNESGTAVTSFTQGEKGSLIFSVQTINLISSTLPLFESTKGWYRVYGTAEWKPMNITKIAEAAETDGLIVSADLSDALKNDSVAIDLKLFTAEQNNFTAEYILEPAFAVGSWQGTPTGSDEPGENIPKVFSLNQNFPNPFNPGTTINYQLPANSFVTLKVYDLIGREIATLVNEVRQAGYHSVPFNASSLSSGLYFYRIQAGNNMAVKKMLLVK